MILLDFFQEHNIKLTKKGEEALIDAAKQWYPSMDGLSDSAISTLILYMDLSEKEVNSFVRIWSKYAKLNLFS